MTKPGASVQARALAGIREIKPMRLTEAQRAELQCIANGERGRSDPSRYMVRMALWRKRLVDRSDKITDAGRQALEQSK